MKALFLLVIMVILVPMAFFAPFSGVLTYLWLALFRPHEWAYSPSAQYSLAVGVATLVGYVVFELSKNPPQLLPNFWMILLWLQLSLSTLLCEYVENSVPKYVEFTKVFVIGMLVSALVNSEERARWLLAVIVGSIGMLAFRSSLNLAVHLGNAPVQGPGGKFEDNNDYALLLNLAFPVLIYFGRSEKKWWLRWGCYLLAAMTAVTVLFSRSRGGFLGLCMACFILILKSRHKVLASVVAAGGIVVALSFAPDSIKERLGTIKQAKEGEITEASALQRLRAWNESLMIIRDHPGLGVGINNMLLVLPRYGNENQEEQRVSHNSYLQVAVDAGIPALMLFLLMLGVTFWRLRKLRHLLREHAPTDRLLNYAHGIEAGMGAYLVSATFLSQYSQEVLFVYVPLVNALMVLARAYEQEAKVREVVSQASVVSRPLSVVSGHAPLTTNH